MDGGIPQQVKIGPVRVRLSGIVRTDGEGQAETVNTPDVPEAVAALSRVARVSGADGVVDVGADYRRQRIASGPLSTQTVVIVQAWGTAVRSDDA
jgi:uncharacterized protein YbjQ (UPF0145 family)